MTSITRVSKTHLPSWHRTYHPSNTSIASQMHRPYIHTHQPSLTLPHAYPPERVYTVHGGSGLCVHGCQWFARAHPLSYRYSDRHARWSPQGWNYKLAPYVDIPLDIVDERLKDFVEFPLSDYYGGADARVTWKPKGSRGRPLQSLLRNLSTMLAWEVNKNACDRCNRSMLVIERIQLIVNINFQLRMHECTGQR